MEQATSEGTLDREQLHELAQQLRVDSVRSAAAAGSGHPTSSISAADLMAVSSRLPALRLRTPRIRQTTTSSSPRATPRPCFTAVQAGRRDQRRRADHLPQIRLRLQGHPTPEIPWVDVATGSLGQGLPISVGIALAGKRLETADYRVWVLCGDSELAEGSIWEAFEHAGFDSLDNIIAIVDVNRLGQRGPTCTSGTPLPWRPARRPSAGTCRRSTATTSRRSTRPTRRRSPPTSLRRSSPAPRRAPASRRSRTSRTSTASPGRSEAAVEELGGERSLRIEVQAPPEAQPSGRGRASRAAHLGARRQGRHPRRLRRRPRLDARSTKGRRARRRGQQFDLRRTLRRQAPGPLFRDVHRRAADGRRGRRPATRG